MAAFIDKTRQIYIPSLEWLNETRLRRPAENNRAGGGEEIVRAFHQPTTSITAGFDMIAAYFLCRFRFYLTTAAGTITQARRLHRVR